MFDPPLSEFLQPLVINAIAFGDGLQAKAGASSSVEESSSFFDQSHAAIMGKEFPICQGALSPPNGKRFPMAKHREAPRLTLQRNLKALLVEFKMTGPELAAKAKLDRKTINNFLNARYDPQPEKVQQIADVFGLTAWHLIMPGLDVKLARTGGLDDIIRLFSMATADDRETFKKLFERLLDQSK